MAELLILPCTWRDEVFLMTYVGSDCIVWDRRISLDWIMLSALCSEYDVQSTQPRPGHGTTQPENSLDLQKCALSHGPRQIPSRLAVRRDP